MNSLKSELLTVRQQLQETAQVNDTLAKENKEIKVKMAEMSRKMQYSIEITTQFKLSAEDRSQVEQALTVRNMEADYEIVK